MNVDWEKLTNPGPTLTPLNPTREQMAFLADVLMNGFLNLDDSQRTIEKVNMHLAYYFPYHLPANMRPMHMIYQIKDFSGLLGFTDIIVGNRCSVLFKLWNPKEFSHKVFRDLKTVHKLVMDELRLQRIGAQTPDLRVVNLAKRLNYRVEGRQAKAFSWNKRLFTNHLMRLLPGDLR